MIEVGMTVIPKSGGLELATIPCDGSYRQTLPIACVLRGFGTVIEVKDIIVDYDSWPNSMYEELGKIPYRNCLVQCDAGIGWAGEGALLVK